MESGKRKHIVLVSKDATLPEYYGPYNSHYTKTPNIDELAAKGTVFNKHYTAAPSTAMAFYAMFTGKYPYESGNTIYVEVEPYKGDTLFDLLYDQGYECHLLWSSNYITKADKFSKCTGRHTIHHESMKFNQSCGINAVYHKENRKRNEEVVKEKFDAIIKEIDTIDYQNKDIFLWIHMPHCIQGRISYGDDIDVFDNLVGELRKRFGDESLFVTADHAHMNGFHHKAGYGFDVDIRATRIPLITPRIEGRETVDFVTSNVQLSDIILNRRIQKLPYVVIDSAYYCQWKRKTAIVKDHFFYIYTKKNKREELYDIELDPHQDINLMESLLWNDFDRGCKTDIRQVVLYPYWDQIPQVVEEMRAIVHSFWQVGPWWYELKEKVKQQQYIRNLLFIRDKFSKRNA